MKTLTFSVPDELRQRLEAHSQRFGRTLSGQIRWCLHIALSLEAENEKLAHERVEAAERMRQMRVRKNVTSSENGSSPSTVLFTPESFVVSTGLLGSWKLAYPSVDVENVLRQAHSWAVSNPEKHKKNWGRFLVNWLKGEQDKMPKKAPEPAKIRPAILDEPDPDPKPLPPEFAEQMRKVVGGMGMR